MKLNHVSVKGYEETEEGLRLCIRAELDEQPAKVWCKLFQLTWIMSPASKMLPADIKFARSDLFLYIPESGMIPETIEALTKTINAVDQRVRDIKEEHSYNFSQVII